MPVHIPQATLPRLMPQAITTGTVALSGRRSGVQAIRKWTVPAILALMFLAGVFAVVDLTIWPVNVGAIKYDAVAHKEVLVREHVTTIILDFLDTHSGALALFASVAIACFTLTLKWSTDNLWSEAQRQRSDARHSIYASQISARAARLSATAAKQTAEATQKLLNELEVPYVVPHDMQFSHSPTEGQITVRFKNFGRSPAIVRSVSATFRITTANVPTQVRFTCGKDFMFEDMIGDKESSERLIFKHDELRLHGQNIDQGIEDLHLMLRFAWQGLIGPSRSEMSDFIWSPQRKRFLRGIQLWDDPTRFAPRPPRTT